MKTAPAFDKPSEATETRHGVVADLLGLERNAVAVAVAIFLMAFGENLWKRFALDALAAHPVSRSRPHRDGRNTRLCRNRRGTICGVTVHLL